MTNTIEIAAEVRDWVSNYGMLKQMGSNLPVEVVSLRDKAIRDFERLGFPTTKHEEWKYTSLRNWVNAGLQPSFFPPQTGQEEDVEGFHLCVVPAQLEGPLVVLVNGHFNAALSRLEGGDIEVLSLKAALESGNEAALAHYGSLAATENSALVALNTAIATDGVFIHIPKNSTSDVPLIVVHFSHGKDVVSQGRTLIVAEDLSETQVLEVFHSWAESADWYNQVSEIHVGKGAKLELTSLQVNCASTGAVTHFAQVEQGQDSTFCSTVMSTSGQMVRNDLQVRHTGTGCNTYMNGLTVLKGESHVDHHTLVDHALPHCYSNENYKTVLDGNSTAVFNGKVMVRPDAQKTNAFQSNKTLLLSEGAKVYAKPQLEIFADDVKCSHGATTGQLDETAMFYMRSRGLSEPKARALLTYAFGAEVLELVNNEELRRQLQTSLKLNLEGM